MATLRVAPVKGLGVVTPAQVHLGSDGVAEDRRLFLLREDGSVLTLRKAPALARVVPTLDLTAGALTVALPDGTRVASELEARGPAVEADLFGKRRRGRVVPGPAADALSAQAGEPLRLVLADRTGVGWDEGPVSLLGRASAAAVGTPGEGDGRGRYRMLVEVEGSEPYEEDGWVGREVRLGDAVVAVTHALERCVVINHDPATGAKDWAGLKTLAAVRGRALTLGVIADVQREGVVRLGDRVEPLS